jgi:hypothetical protein
MEKLTVKRALALSFVVGLGYSLGAFSGGVIQYVITPLVRFVLSFLPL